jgi:hypothetical protein
MIVVSSLIAAMYQSYGASSLRAAYSTNTQQARK